MKPPARIPASNGGRHRRKLRRRRASLPPPARTVRATPSRLVKVDEPIAGSPMRLDVIETLDPSVLDNLTGDLTRS